MTPDPGPVFAKFLTPGSDPGPKEKRRILPESTPDPVSPLLLSHANRSGSYRTKSEIKCGNELPMPDQSSGATPQGCQVGHFMANFEKFGHF